MADNKDLQFYEEDLQIVMMKISDNDRELLIKKL